MTLQDLKVKTVIVFSIFVYSIVSQMLPLALRREEGFHVNNHMHVYTIYKNQQQTTCTIML